MNEKDYIKIPKDFQSLHDLKDLVNNYGLVNRLSKALDGYQRMYIESYLMTIDEVLDYIPASQQKLYKICVRNKKNDMKKFVEWSETPVGEIAKPIYKKLSIRDVAKEYMAAGIKDWEKEKGKKYSAVKSDAKIFMVNTVDKLIDVCYWADKKLIGINLESVSYKEKIDFNLDERTRKLMVMPHYEYSDNQAVGGVWINGQARGYLSGHAYHPYQIHGYDIYKFCTRTNKYIGYAGFKEDPKRPWIGKTSRY